MSGTAADQADPCASPVPMASWYLIDGQDRIIDVSPDWDAAAEAGQGAVSSFRTGIIGQPLARFLAGDTTRMFIDAALQAARLTGKPRTLNYRCDTPLLARQMQMRLVPGPQAEVRVEHVLLQSRPRTAPLRFVSAAAAPRPPGVSPWLRCSVCLWVCTPQGYWEPPEHLQAARPLVVDYTVCPRCHAEAASPASG
jgi:hypothetical protein